MGNKNVIDAEAKANIDDAATMIKKASQGYGFRTPLSDERSRVYFIYNNDKHLQLHGPLNIERIGWDNMRTFGNRILGDFKPFFLCGYYTNQDGYTYELSMPDARSQIGKVGFRGTDDSYYPQVLLDNMHVKPGYFSYIQPNEDVLLYMVGEMEIFNKADLQRDGVNPILHLVFNLRINSIDTYNTEQSRGPSFDVLVRQYDDEAIQAGVFGRNSSIAGAIHNEVDWRPIFLMQERGVDQFKRRMEGAAGYVDRLEDICNIVNRQRTNQGELTLSHLDIDFEEHNNEWHNEKLMGIIYYDNEKNTWSIAFPEVLLVQKDGNPLPRESFGAYVVRGYLTLQQENRTFLLKNKEAMNGAVYIRNETERAADGDSYYYRLRWYQEHKNIWDKNRILKEVAKEQRNLTIQIEDMDFTENGKSLNVLDCGEGTYNDRAELALVFYGNGLIGGKHVTVMTLRLRLKDMARDNKVNGKYTFRFERYEENTKPITAYFQDF